MWWKKILQKKGSIAPSALKETINSINVVGFLGMIHRWELTSLNINFVWPMFQLIDVFVYLPYFTLSIEIIFVLVFLLLHWSPPVPIILNALIEILNLCHFIDFLNACNDRNVRHISCTNHLHAYNRLLKMGMIWWKKLPQLFWLKIITSKKTN